MKGEWASWATLKVQANDKEKAQQALEDINFLSQFRVSFHNTSHQYSFISYNLQNKVLKVQKWLQATKLLQQTMFCQMQFKWIEADFEGMAIRHILQAFFLLLVFFARKSLFCLRLNFLTFPEIEPEIFLTFS